jgi:hypothetical protein
MEYIFYFILIMYFKHNGMFCTKIIIASQARCGNQYENWKRKVMKRCSNIYYMHQRFYFFFINIGLMIAYSGQN